MAQAIAIVVGLTVAAMLIAFLLPSPQLTLNSAAGTSPNAGPVGVSRQNAGGKSSNDKSGESTGANGSNPETASSGPPAVTKQDQLISSGTTEEAETDGSGDIDKAAALAANDESTAEMPSIEDLPANTFLTLGAKPKAGPPIRANSGARESGKAEFFGVEAQGRKFVYVVDVSSSMTGEKFEKARSELLNSIGRLRDGQYFYITFFNDIAYYQPITGFVPARSRKKKREINDWIMHASPTGGTSPFEAIAHAIQLRPDAIYVLSDGEFYDNVVSQVDSINLNYPVPIHAICFGIDAATLKSLASDNGGTYRYIQ